MTRFSSSLGPPAVADVPLQVNVGVPGAVVDKVIDEPLTPLHTCIGNGVTTCPNGFGFTVISVPDNKAIPVHPLAIGVTVYLILPKALLVGLINVSNIGPTPVPGLSVVEYPEIVAVPLD